jgi:aspartate racemase
MKMNAQKTIGVLGGMGPAATADFYLKLIKATPAESDQDHIKVLIFSNPQIPDRTAAIRGEGPDPLPALIESANALVRAGADFLTMPCVTAHAFFEKLQQAVPVPILHLIRETADFLCIDRQPQRLGVLATSGTLQARLFEAVFEPRGIRIVVPDPAYQARCVMEAIYGLKQGRPLDGPRQLIREAAAHLIAQGVNAIILGCTEIPLLLAEGDAAVPVIDPTWVLAQAAVGRARGTPVGPHSSPRCYQDRG